MRFSRSRIRYLAGAAAAFSISACTETKTEIVTVVDTVVIEAPIYAELPEGAAGFVGYRSSSATPASACGQCHAGKQSGWVTTAHADAWAGLQSSGGAQGFCEGCHTVNALGNTSTAVGGWTATADDRYHDVGCESCHGPGQTHIDVPESGAPQATLAVGVDLESGCGQCHQGTHHPFVEDWAQSGHAQVVGFAAGREECAGCHKGQGALIAWGENDNYLEKDGDPLPTTCGVCHDPHGSDNPGQTRFSAASTSIENNLCAKCHNRRTVPDPNSTHGLAPHAPEPALMLGDAGWFPPGMEFLGGKLFGTHTAANPDFCATCHLESFEVTDEEGGFVFQSTGHLFTSIPCVDEAGIPVAGDCAYTTEARTFKGCTTAGCHGTEGAAATAVQVASLRMADRSGEVLDLLWQVDPNLEGPGGEIDAADDKFTTAEGALFNVNLAQFPNEGSDEPGDNPVPADVTGSSTHNPFLTEALLIGSKQAVENEYGVGAAGHYDYGPVIQQILDRARRHGGMSGAP